MTGKGGGKVCALPEFSGFSNSNKHGDVPPEFLRSSWNKLISVKVPPGIRNLIQALKYIYELFLCGPFLFLGQILNPVQNELLKQAHLLGVKSGTIELNRIWDFDES